MLRTCFLWVGCLCMAASALAQGKADIVKQAIGKIQAMKTGQEVLAVLAPVMASAELSDFEKGSIGYHAGMVCRSLKAGAEARQIWNDIRKLDIRQWPGAEAWLETARMDKAEKKSDDAREGYLHVLDGADYPQPQRQYAGCELFYLETSLERWQDAAAILAKAEAALKPWNGSPAPLLNCKAVLLQHDGKVDQALEMYLEAARSGKAKPSDASQGWNGAARILADKGETMRALDCLQKAKWPDKALKRHLEETLAEPPFTVTPVFLDKPDTAFTYFLDNKFIGGWCSADGGYRTPDEPTVKETGFNASKYSFEKVRVAAEGGYNILFSLFGPWKGGFGELQTMDKALRFWAEGCQRHRMSFMSVLQFSQRSAQYRKFTSGNGIYAKEQVCPADWDYWKNEMLARAILSAEAAKDHPAIVGTVLDFEMYVKDGSNYAGPCMCDRCFEEFLTMTKNTSPRPAFGERLAWVKAQGLFKRYRDYATWKMTETCRRVEKAIHAVKPDFIIAYVPFFEWFSGCTRGLGTPGMPVVVLSEMEYSTGFTPAIAQRVARIGKEGYPALFVPGIWTLKFPPQTIAGHMFRMADVSHGVWIYTMEAAWDAKYNAPGHGSKMYYPGSAYLQYQKAFASVANALRMKALEPDYAPNFPLPEVPDIQPPQLELKQLASPLAIDGTLADGGWESAPELRLLDNANGSRRNPSPVIKLAFDKDFLYVGAWIPEPDMTKLKAVVTQNDDFKIFSDDILEFFIGFEDNTRVAHFGINANGNHAEHCVFVAGEDRSWKGEPVVRTVRGADHWTMEVAFPWSRLTEAPVDEVTFNVTMSRSYQPNSAWSPTFGLYMNPDRFGRLLLRR